MNKTNHRTCFNATKISLLLLALLLTLIMPGPAGQVLAGSAGPQIQVENASGSIAGSIPVRILLYHPGDILGGSLALHYNPEYLQPVMEEEQIKIAPGALFATAMAAQDNAGIINLAVAGTEPAAEADPDAPVEFCTVYFKLIKTGETPLTITDLELSDGYNIITDAATTAGMVTAENLAVTAAAGQTIYPNSTATRAVKVSLAGQVGTGALPEGSLPATSIQLQILDDQVPANIAGSLDDLQLDDEGKFSGEWTIPAEASAGDYTLQAVYNGVTFPDLGTFTVIMLGAPVADPPPQQFTENQQVTLTCPTEGAAIYYTLDEQEEPGPDNPSSILYSEPILLDTTATIRAVAVKDGVSSEIVSFTYTLTSDECFIATAAYGSKFTPAVTLLRDFRDRYLLTNAPGRAFVAFYYQNSPPLAGYIAGHDVRRAVVRGLLTPVVVGVYMLYHPGLLAVTIGLILVGFLWLHKRRRLSRCQPAIVSAGKTRRE